MTTPSEDVGLIERLTTLSNLEPGWYANVGRRTGEACCRAMREAAASLASKDEEIRRKDAALRAAKLQALNAAYNLSQGTSVSQDDIVRAFHAIADTARAPLQGGADVSREDGG